MKKHSGFTLIELMIAVVIICIVAAIAIPKFVAFLSKSRQVQAVSTSETAMNYYGVIFSLEKGDSAVLIKNTFGGTYSVRKVVLTEYSEKTEWIKVLVKSFRDDHYQRGIHAYYLYGFHGMPCGYVRP